MLENYENLEKYDLVTISRVFSFTYVPNTIYKRGICKDPNHPELSLKKNIRIGGTGFYFDKAPDLDYCIEHIMPDYHLYDEYIYKLINKFVDSYRVELTSKVEKGKVYSKEDNDDLPSGVSKVVRVYIIQKRKISVGDKVFIAKLFIACIRRVLIQIGGNLEQYITNAFCSVYLDSIKPYSCRLDLIPRCFPQMLIGSKDIKRRKVFFCAFTRAAAYQIKIYSLVHPVPEIHILFPFLVLRLSQD